MAAEASGSGKDRSSGLLASLRNLAETLVGILQTRLDLLATEIEEERVRLSRIWLLAGIALFFFALGVLTLTLFVIVLFWDTQRLQAIGVLTVLYLVAGAGCALAARRQAAAKSKLFSSSIAELAKDREQLTG